MLTIRECNDVYFLKTVINGNYWRSVLATKGPTTYVRKYLWHIDAAEIQSHNTFSHLKDNKKMKFPSGHFSMVDN
jgi:hypothetical protein